MLYAGLLRTASSAEDDDGMKQMYVLNVPADRLPKDYKGPDLVIESRKVGNEGRFVNDPINSGRIPNVHVEFYYDPERQVPLGIMVASRHIEVGEELLFEYGIGYWQIMNRNIMRTHTDFWRCVSPWCARMKSMLGDRDISIPNKPDFIHDPPSPDDYSPLDTKGTRLDDNEGFTSDDASSADESDDGGKQDDNKETQNTDTVLVAMYDGEATV